MKYIFFDLDGTLLPMDTDTFTNKYFELLAEKFSPLGYDHNLLVKAIYGGMKAMIMNDGKSTNETRFWQAFVEISGYLKSDVESIFLDFYNNEFNSLVSECTCTEDSNQLIKILKDKGYKIVLATNPIFPRVATFNRIKWANMAPNDFELITVYEDCKYCKPNELYYEEIAEKLNISLKDIIMCGNDVLEDMVTCQKCGMKPILITDYILNNKNLDISKYEKFSLKEFKNYIINHF